MMSFLNLLSVLAFWASHISAVLADVNFGGLENLNVLQMLDIASPYLKVSLDIECQNVGTDDVSEYFLAIPDSKAQDLSMIVAKRTQDMEDMEVEPVKGHQIPGQSLFSIKFNKPLEPSQVASFGTLLVFSRGSSPYPAEAKQADSQWMLYDGSLNYVSLYKTRVQSTQLNPPTHNYELLSSSERAEHYADETTGRFGFKPIENVEALESIPLRFRYENPVPLIYVENLNRSIWVSHWGGSVSFDESYDVHNVGTKIEGSFSRLDFSRPKIGLTLNTAAIQLLKIALPESHREEYYVDLIGNVSTSVVSDDTIQIAPRYPIMGGWFYNFTIGWASDLSNFVHKTTSSDYILSVPIIGGPARTAYGKVHTKVVLPEGATNAEVYSQVPYDSQQLSLTHSYLDIFGRPTVELEFSNLVSEQQSSNIYVAYRYSTVTAFKKPFAYIVAISMCMLGSRFVISLF